jgi:hypothetical protein
VQRDLEAAAERRAVDEREGRDVESFSRAKTRWPSSPSSTACSRSVMYGMPVMSAPTQKMYGLPVSAMNAGSASVAVVIASSSERRPAGPKLFGFL